MSDVTKWTGRFTNFPGPSLQTFLAMIYQISGQFTNFPATFPAPPEKQKTVFVVGGGVGGHAGSSCQSAACPSQLQPAQRLRN